MKRRFLAALAGIACATCVYAQSDAPGPLVTPSGELRFVRAGSDFAAMLDTETFDRFASKALVHFDDVDGARASVTRTLVQTDRGPELYDFRRRPPTVQRSDTRMTIERVFWQGDEVVMQSAQGWYRFKGGTFARLRSSKMTFH